jgi:hypothetical protein
VSERTAFDANRRAHDLIASKYDLKHTEIFNHIEQTRLSALVRGLVAASGISKPMVLDLGAGTG